MKLWLDDIRKPPSDGWYWVNNVEDAKKELLKGHVEIASLDHDLGGVGETDIMVAASKPGADGIDLAKWMCGTGVFPNKLIIIHSWNSEGSKNMRDFLVKWDCPVMVFLMPYSTFRLSEEQIKKFNDVQKCGYVHPMTCGFDRTNEHHLDGEGILLATIDRWVCPYCEWQQYYGSFELEFYDKFDLANPDPLGLTRLQKDIVYCCVGWRAAG